MAIEFVGGVLDRQAAAASGTTDVPLNSGLTGGLASSVSAGDLVIVAFSTGSTANRSLSITDGTTDYTLIGSELYSADNIDTNLRVAYKFMGSTPDAAVTIGPTGSANDAGIAAVYVFRGVDSTTPLDVAVTTATGTNTVLANPPSITPVTTGAYIVAIGAGGHNRGIVSTYTSSDLTDFRSTAASDTNDSVIGIGHKPDWVSGAFNPAVFGFGDTDNTNFSWAAMSIALRPALAAAALEVDPGSYLFSGQDAELLRGILVVASGGSYLFIGQDAVLSAEPTLNAVPGAYLFSGQNVNFLASGRVSAEVGAYLFAGQDATFAVGGVMITEAGAYVFSGQTAVLERGLIFVTSAGSYSFSGTSVQFSTTDPTTPDIRDIYRVNRSKMPFWRAVRAKEFLWPKWKF